MTAITTAVRLLRVAATELKNCHTIGGDWGDEHEALDAYNEHMATVATLEHMAPQCLTQIEEPAGVAPAAVAPQGERQWICPTRTVADLVNNLLTLDQALPVYGAQYIEIEGRRRAVAVPPTVSRERVKDGRWIGQGEELNAAVIWTRAEQPAAVAGPAISDEDRMTLAGALGLLRGHRYDGSADALQRVLDANAAAPALEAPAAPARIYVSARQCDVCDHIGINDEPDNKAACNACDWRGDSPREDKCPDCNRVGTMTTACPECGARTSLLAETHLLAAAPQAPAAPSRLPSGWVPCILTHDGQHPEEVAYGPQIMMDRLKKWLGRYFEMLAQKVLAEPVHAEMLAALQAVAMDSVHVGAGENTISDAARDKVDAVLEKIGAPWPSPGAAPAAPAVDAPAERDAAFEAVRNRLCGLQRYSFVLDDDGVVRRAQDRTGNWIEFDDAHALFDPVAVDAAIAAQAKEGGAAC